MDLIKLFQGGFPATIETISFLQDSYTKPLKAISGLAGENAILQGMNLKSGNIGEGWFVREGEPVFFKLSLAGETVRVIDKTIQVPYNIDDNNDGDLDLKDAYVSRYATTEENELEADEVLVYEFPYSDLVKIGSFKNILPIGSAILWFDPLNIPYGYRVMDGTGGDIVKSEGTAKAIDLRDKFIKMAGSENSTEQTGGSRSFTISSANLPPHTHATPAHTHAYKDGYYIEKEANGIDGSEYVGEGNRGSSGSDWDNNYMFLKNRTTELSTAGITGNGAFSNTAINNEPSFYTAIWIQYVGL